MSVCCNLTRIEGTSLLACEQPPNEGRRERGRRRGKGKTNSVSEASCESKNSASEADGEGGTGVPVDIVFDVPFRPLVINLSAQISQDGN